MKNKHHIAIMIGCDTFNDHADFIVDEGQFICKHCGKDFTEEVEEIAFSLINSLEWDVDKIKN